jgi:hypothetical protein
MTTLEQYLTDITDSLNNYLLVNIGNKHTVNLHLHYDRDDEFDFNGMHNIHISTYAAAERVYKTFYIELENESPTTCHKVLDDVLKIVKEFDPTAIKKEYIHR